MGGAGGGGEGKGGGEVVCFVCLFCSLVVVFSSCTKKRRWSIEKVKLTKGVIKTEEEEEKHRK